MTVCILETNAKKPCPARLVGPSFAVLCRIYFAMFKPLSTGPCVIIGLVELARQSDLRPMPRGPLDLGVFLVASDSFLRDQLSIRLVQTPSWSKP